MARRCAPCAIVEKDGDRELHRFEADSIAESVADAHGALLAGAHEHPAGARLLRPQAVVGERSIPGPVYLAEVTVAG